MKQIVTNYSFTPGAAGAGTITLPDLTTIDLARLIMVVNVTRKRVLYNIGDPLKNATVVGNVITLGVSTSDCANNDVLSITYDISLLDGSTVDYQMPTSVDSEQITWKRNFNGAALDPKYWNVVAQGAHQTIAVATGQLTLGAGTTANEVTTIRSLQSFTLPFRAEFALSLSQRIVNQTFYVELVNAAGDTYVGWVFDGVTAANAKIEAANANNTGSGSPSAAIVCSTTATAATAFIIDARVDEVDWLDSVADAVSAETIRAARTRAILNTDEQYFVQIRIVNGAVAPASNTNLIFEYILVQDVAKLVAEISAGRGNATLSRAIPVIPMGTSSSVTLVASAARIGETTAGGIWVDDTSTPLAAAATFTGATRDMTGVATAVAFSNLSFPKEIRISAEADVGGTLYLEVSRDNVNWRRIKSVALAAAAGTGTVFYGEIIHAPSTRYARAVFINGATLQAQFMLQTYQVAA